MHRGLTPTFKAAMQVLGRPVGEMRPPYSGLEEKEFHELEQYIKTTDLVD